MVTATSEKWKVRCATVCSVLVLAFAIGANTLPAQQERGVISVDLGTGFSKGLGGGFRAERNMFAGMGQVARRILARDSRSVLAAFNVTGFTTLLSEDCVVRVNSDGTHGGCAPDFPGGAALSVLAGVQQKVRGIAAIRLFAGPALFSTSEPVSRLGTQTRIDISIPAHEHVSFVMWGQYSFMPIAKESNGQIRLGGAGIRFQ